MPSPKPSPSILKRPAVRIRPNVEVPRKRVSFADSTGSPLVAIHWIDEQNKDPSNVPTTSSNNYAPQVHRWRLLRIKASKSVLPHSSPSAGPVFTTAFAPDGSEVVEDYTLDRGPYNTVPPKMIPLVCAPVNGVSAPPSNGAPSSSTVPSPVAQPPPVVHPQDPFQPYAQQPPLTTKDVYNQPSGQGLAESLNAAVKEQQVKDESATIRDGLAALARNKDLLSKLSMIRSNTSGDSPLQSPQAQQPPVQNYYTNNYGQEPASKRPRNASSMIVENFDVHNGDAVHNGGSRFGNGFNGENFCRFHFFRGGCYRGNNCRFSHDIEHVPMAMRSRVRPPQRSGYTPNN